MKRGQLTLFVILAVAVVLVILFLFVFNTNNSESVINSDVRHVYDAVLLCVNSVTADSLVHIGQSAGYFEVPQELDNDLSIAYYYKDRENTLPDIEIIEEELSDYNEALLFFCFEKAFSEFTDVVIYSEDITVEANINEDDTVDFSVSYPFTAQKQDTNTSYYFNDNFDVSYNVRLYSIHSFISDLLNLHITEPRAMCISCLADLAVSYELYLDLWDVGEDVLFFVSDPNSPIPATGRDVPYEFYFMIKLNSQETQEYDPFEEL